MEKKLLRQIISGLTPNETFQMTLVCSPDDTDTYRMVSARTGRGKGGSRLALVEHVATGQFLTIGTPENDKILNMTVNYDGNAVFFGVRSVHEIAPTYPTNAARAVELKETFKSVLARTGIPNNDEEVYVTIESRNAREIAGTWRITDGKQLRGRGGQIVLTLQAHQRRIELWSYRHSGVIDNITFSCL